MDRTVVWQVIDAQRLSLADLLDDLTPAEWETPSLCDGWRVREVAAHLTLAPTGLGTAVVALARARGDLNRMIRDTALRQARLPVERYAGMVRDMVGSRRTAPGVSHFEPLIDVLVHGQDITIPLGRDRPVPVPAAAAAVERIWPNLWPFRAARRLSGLHIAATDHPWSAGEGPAVTGPISAILLLLTGRPAALPRLSGPGLPALADRFPQTPR